MARACVCCCACVLLSLCCRGCVVWLCVVVCGCVVRRSHDFVSCWQRTKRSVNSVTMHVHVRALVQRTSHGMWRTSHMHAAWPLWPRRLLLFCQEPPARCSFLASQNGRKECLLVHVQAVGPRELTGTSALKAWRNRWRPGAVYKYRAW